MRATSDAEPKRRWPRYLLVALLILVAVFYLGGGFYFSNVLRNDLLVVSPNEPEFDLDVVTVFGDTITLRESDGRDDELRSNGIYGVQWETGHGQVGAIEMEGATEVTRAFTVLDGAPPEPGDVADVNKTAFPPDPRAAHSVSYETVQYDTPLGPMDAWLIPGRGDTWAVMAHGLGADRDETLRIMQPFIDASIPVLSIRYRNDSDSPMDPSGYYQFGVTEWEDIKGAVEYVVGEGAEDIVMVGLSTGAAHIASFLEKSDLRDRVIGAILDAPNINVSRTVDYGASQRTLPGTSIPIPQSLTSVAKIISEMRFGIDFSELDYTNRLANSGFPILVIHGTEDATVPLDQSQRLADTGATVTLVVVDDAFHVGSWNKGPSAYESTVANFLNRIGV